MRGDLPPESEVPIITVESAESERASAYLSFASDILEANEITDYLVRVIQPRLTSIQGVQEAEILGGRTFAMRIWLDPARMAALGIYPTQVREALAANNFPLRGGADQGQLGHRQPDHQYGPQYGRSIRAAGDPQPGQHHRAHQGHRHGRTRRR